MSNSSNTNTNSSSPLKPAPYTSHFVEVAGLKLHYQDYGGASMRPMLMVHGGAAHGHWFDFVAAAFTADHHVLSLDQRGHGDSQWADEPDYTYLRYAADLAEFAEKLDLRDYVLVGHSMGGAVSLQHAALYPGRVGRLVIVDTIARMTAERAASLRDVGSREGSNYATREEFIKRYRLRPAGTNAAPEVLRHLAENSARQFPDGTWRHKFDRRVYATRETTDGLPSWKQIRVPALLMKAERSERITPQIVAEVKSLCPQVEFTEVPGCDHHVTLDNPAGFVSALRAFLAKP